MCNGTKLHTKQRKRNNYLSASFIYCKLSTHIKSDFDKFGPDCCDFEMHFSHSRKHCSYNCVHWKVHVRTSYQIQKQAGRIIQVPPLLFVSASLNSISIELENFEQTLYLGHVSPAYKIIPHLGFTVHL